ncbi:MAG: hypothetical protein WC384_11140 [Prolixibacteraceae bacterium]|jgi:hypothetical protein
MRTSPLKRFAGIFLALFVTATVAVSSNNSDGRGRNRTSGANCVRSISGLNQDQKDKIISMNAQHQATMNELREKRRSTIDQDEKNQIREQMVSQVATHRNEVKALLNPDQQKQFEQFPRNGNNQQFGNNGAGQRRGNGNCNGQGYYRNRQL